jgi:hypothetical protein
LYFQVNQKPLSISYGRSVYSYKLKSDIDCSRANSAIKYSVFFKYLYSLAKKHQLSDKVAQEKLGLTADEFQ